jgi:hypothetical protein
MVRKILLLIVIVLLFAWLGGIFSVSLSPFSLTINKPEKDFLKRAAGKAKNLIYREAASHTPPGDVLPDQIDKKIEQGVKDHIN